MQEFVEYIKIHIISLKQDQDKFTPGSMDSICIGIEIDTCRYLLGIAEEYHWN